jgi:hypothetical protein
MENLGIFYDHLVYYTATGNILWPFGILCGHLVYFPPFWYFVRRKIWQRCFIVKSTIRILTFDKLDHDKKQCTEKKL